MKFYDHNSTFEQVQNMTAEEAAEVLFRYAGSNITYWTPHISKAIQIAIDTLREDSK